MQLAEAIHIFSVWFTGTLLLRVVNRFEPNPRLAAVLQFLIIATGRCGIASRFMR